MIHPSTELVVTPIFSITPDVFTFALYTLIEFPDVSNISSNSFHNDIFNSPILINNFYVELLVILD